MSEIIIKNTDGKEKIMSTLLDFDKGENKNDEERYERADQLSECKKVDLETAKTDIERYSDSQKNFIAVFSAIGLILQVWISSWPTGNLRFGLSFLVPLIFAWLAISVWLKVEEKVSWLHILKIAIAQKAKSTY